MKKDDVQNIHESIVLKYFEDYLKKQNIVMKLIDRPEPPDAVVEIENSVTWIELTNHFFNKDVAKSVVNAHAYTKKMCIVQPLEQSIKRFKDTILKKYDKATMQQTFERYGQGILIVGIHDPFVTLDDIVKNERKIILEKIKAKKNIFKTIYLYCANESSFVKFLSL